ncbi:MAG: cytochrome b/b6 domain-containing protein [Marinibacterium sp.]
MDVWDPLVRIIHWSVALGVLLNATVIDTESKVHAWIGYTVLSLVILRLAWAVLGPWNARFAAFPPSPVRALRYVAATMRGDRTVHLTHNPLGALMVYNIWATLIALGVTGYMMTTIRYFGIDWVEEVHDLAFNWLMLSVALHVAGVVFDSRRTGVNLLRGMITGRKLIPKGTELE